MCRRHTAADLATKHVYCGSDSKLMSAEKAAPSSSVEQAASGIPETETPSK